MEAGPVLPSPQARRGTRGPFRPTLAGWGFSKLSPGAKAVALLLSRGRLGRRGWTAAPLCRALPAPAALSLLALSVQLSLRLKAMKRQVEEAEEEIDRLESSKKKLQRELEEQMDVNEQLQGQLHAMKKDLRWVRAAALRSPDTEASVVLSRRAHGCRGTPAAAPSPVSSPSQSPAVSQAGFIPLIHKGKLGLRAGSLAPSTLVP